MYRSNTARVIPLIILVVVVGALIFGLITVGRYIFGGGSNTDEQSVVDQARDQLLTVDTERSMRMTIRGPIVGDEAFRTFEVRISPIQRQYIVYDGYREAVSSQRTFDNNSRAYEQFVYALDKAALTRPGKFTEEEASDIRGICAVGRVSEFELYDGETQLQRWWTSSCKGSPGTLGASVSQVTDLFSAQLPDVELDFRSNFNRLQL